MSQIETRRHPIAIGQSESVVVTPTVSGVTLAVDSEGVTHLVHMTQAEAIRFGVGMIQSARTASELSTAHRIQGLNGKPVT